MIQQGDALYVFKHKKQENVFVLIDASDSELATLRAWHYDPNLTILCGFNDFIASLKRGDLCKRQPEAEHTEKVG